MPTYSTRDDTFNIVGNTECIWAWTEATACLYMLLPALAKGEKTLTVPFCWNNKLLSEDLICLQYEMAAHTGSIFKCGTRSQSGRTGITIPHKAMTLFLCSHNASGSPGNRSSSFFRTKHQQMSSSAHFELTLLCMGMVEGVLWIVPLCVATLVFEWRLERTVTNIPKYCGREYRFCVPSSGQVVVRMSFMRVRRSKTRSQVAFCGKMRG